MTEQLRKITGSLKGHKRQLLKDLNFKSIQEAKRNYDVIFSKNQSIDKTWEDLRNEYNNAIDILIENRKEAKTNKRKTDYQTKTNEKSIINLGKLAGEYFSKKPELVDIKKFHNSVNEYRFSNPSNVKVINQFQFWGILYRYYERK